MITFRQAGLDDVQLLLRWAAEEGWNPGLEDAPAFYASDPNGFFVACDGSSPIAGISVVNHNEGFAFLGLYIVRPEFRGKGIGYALWQKAIAHAGGRTIGLDGVAEQQENYKASGFKRAGTTTRFAGKVIAQVSRSVSEAAPNDITILTALEAEGSGQLKPKYLKNWLQQCATRKTFLCRDGSDIAGFCTIRRCQSASKIGPLFAKDEQTAKKLILHAADEWKEEITIDVPSTSSMLTKICDALNLKPGFQTARMYKGNFEIQEAPVFAVTTLELG